MLNGSQGEFQEDINVGLERRRYSIGIDNEMFEDLPSCAGDDGILPG